MPVAEILLRGLTGVSQAAIFLAAMTCAEELATPRKVIDVIEQPFKRIIDQKQSQKSEYKAIVADIKSKTSSQLSSIMKIESSKRPINDEDVEELLGNLFTSKNITKDILKDDASEKEEEDVMFRAAFGRRSDASNRKDDFQEVYRVLSDAEKQAMIANIDAPGSAVGSTILTRVLSLSAQKHSALINLTERFMELEQMLDQSFDGKLAEHISPFDAFSADLSVVMGTLAGACASAAASHRFMVWAAQKGQLWAAGYNAANNLSSLGLSDLYASVKIRSEKAKHFFDSSIKSYFSIRSTIPNMYRMFPSVFLFILFYTIASDFNDLCSLSKERELLALDDQLQQYPSLASIGLWSPQKYIELIKPQCEWMGEVVDDEEVCVLAPKIWPGATAADPFGPWRIAMQLVSSPVFDNVIYRGIVFNRLLTVVGTSSPSVLWAHVLSAIVTSANADERVNLMTVFNIPISESVLFGISIVQAIGMQMLYKATGSLLACCALSSASNAALLAYEFCTREDFVKQHSWLFKAATELEAWLLQPFFSPRLSLQSIISWQLFEYRKSRIFSAALSMVNSKRPDEASGIYASDITEDQIDNLAIRIMEVYASSYDPPEEKGQRAGSTFGSIPTLHARSLSERRLASRDIVNLLVAIEAAIVRADRRPIREISMFAGNFNFRTADSWNGENIVMQRCILDSFLRTQRPDLRSAMRASEFSAHQIYRSQPLSANKSAGKNQFLSESQSDRALYDELMLNATILAVERTYPSGLSLDELGGVLRHVLWRAVEPTVLLDYNEFVRSLFTWYDLESVEPFLDLLEGMYTRLHSTYTKEAHLFTRVNLDDFQCELAGRAINVQDIMKLDRKMKVHIDAALTREGMSYLHSLGLTPMAFSRLLVRYKSRYEDCSKLDREWREYLESPSFQRSYLDSFVEKAKVRPERSVKIELTIK